MSSISCSSHILILVAIVVLIIAFTDNIFQSVPILKKLFTDSFNYVLLISAVILLILLDLPSGIIVAFLVLYLSVYINNNKKHQHVSSFANVERKNNNLNMINDIPRQLLSNSEFVYDNKPAPNGNIPPFKDLSKEEIAELPIQPGFNKSCPDPDFITKVNPPNRDGYDVTGCRYDFKDSPQNLTKYGPPLAQCGTYDKTKMTTCGTLFYPLNE
jgi:hypothetical protein